MSFTKTARNGDVMAPKGSTGGLFSLPEPGVPSVSNVPFPLKSRGGTRTRPNCRAQNSTDQKHHFGWGHQRSCSRATRHAAQADENASLATSPIRLVARGGQGNLTDLAQELPFFHRVLCASTPGGGITPAERTASGRGSAERSDAEQVPVTAVRVAGRESDRRSAPGSAGSPAAAAAEFETTPHGLSKKGGLR